MKTPLYRPEFDMSDAVHHPAVTAIVESIKARIGREDNSFFQASAAYYLCVMAATMRVQVNSEIFKTMPVNAYVINLAGSGYGKGHSMHIFERELLRSFRNRFMNDTLPVLTENALWDIAHTKAGQSGKDPQVEFDAAEKELRTVYGAYPFVFKADGSNVPALLQLRNQMLIRKCGALNLKTDEIGSNLSKAIDVLVALLELYDQGHIEDHITKNASDSKRAEQREGSTPTNMLLFGTPHKLFDGAVTEKEFYSLLETGYARRCIFGFGTYEEDPGEEQDVEDLYDTLAAAANDPAISQWAHHFHQLANPAMLGWTVEMDRAVTVRLLNYKKACERAAATWGENDEIRKAELMHRYSKAMKLAGAFAFLDQASDMGMDHLMAAILIVEDSGEAFGRILSREPYFAKLARFIASRHTPITHAGLVEALPFYKDTQSKRNEQIALAASWGYDNHIIIRKTLMDGIEFFSGESLEETDLNALTVSYSEEWAYNYLSERPSFEDLEVLVKQPGMHWCNHALKDGHRSDDNVIEGFDMIVVDVDGDLPLELTHDLLAQWKFMTYTTKSHDPDDEHRYRIIIPMNYRLKLDKEDYRTFMDNVRAWLPANIGAKDETWNQRSKKWETNHNAEVFYNDNPDAVVLDVVNFIPKTSRNERHVGMMQSLQSLDSFERWFAQRMMTEGNRNNEMLKYTMALVDHGYDLKTVAAQVHAFNKKLPQPLTEDEIEQTVLVTASKRYS